MQRSTIKPMVEEDGSSHRPKMDLMDLIKELETLTVLRSQRPEGKGFWNHEEREEVRLKETARRADIRFKRSTS